jgi:hypothetical protein
MAEPGAGCNPRSGTQRIPDDINSPLTVDKSHVKAHFAVLPGGLLGHKFRSCGKDALPLPVRHSFGGNGMCFGSLDFDEHQLCTIAQDEINLACRTTPATGLDSQAFAPIGGLDLILGHPSAVMGNRPLQPFPASFSAV